MRRDFPMPFSASWRSALLVSVACDILVGVALTRLPSKVGADTARPDYPDIQLCALSLEEEEGPVVERPGHGPTLEAMGGPPVAASRTHTTGEPPVATPPV